MKVNYPILTLFLFLISPFYLSSQQIQKGLTSINGVSQLNRTEYLNYNFENLALSPSFGKLINHHFFIGGKMILERENSSGNGKNFGGLSVSKELLSYRRQSVEVSAQYYFNPKKKWVFFSELAAEYAHIQAPTYPEYSDFKLSRFTFGFGVNHFFNKEIAFQVKLYGQYYHKNFVSDYRYDYNNGSPWIKIGLTNFINFNDSTAFSKNYIGRGRQVINTYADIVPYTEHIPTPVENSGFNIQLNYGYFLLKGFLVGISAEGGRDFAPSVYAQYYQKVYHKLYCHLKAKNSYYFDTGLTYGLSAGLNYFLTPYTMIEADLVNYQRQYKYKEPFWIYYHPNLTSYGPQIRMRYFLR